MAVEGVDFVLSGGEVTDEINIGFSSNESVSVPEDGACWTIETGEDGSLGIEILVEELGELFCSCEVINISITNRNTMRESYPLRLCLLSSLSLRMTFGWKRES